MTSSVIKRIRSVLGEGTTADGLLYNDWNVVSPCQVKCVETLSRSIQLEEEAYLTDHPEVYDTYLFHIIPSFITSKTVF